MQLRVRVGHRSRDVHHLRELVAALAAQHDMRWRLRVVGSSRSVDAESVIDAYRPLVGSRVVMVTSPIRRLRRRRDTIELRIDDVPLAAFVGEINAACGAPLLLGSVEQLVRPVTWPDGTAGWAPVRAPTTVGATPVATGNGATYRSAEVVLMRRRWVTGSDGA